MRRPLKSGRRDRTPKLLRNTKTLFAAAYVLWLERLGYEPHHTMRTVIARDAQIAVGQR